jgi:hypothetical protein
MKKEEEKKRGAAARARPGTLDRIEAARGEPGARCFGRLGHVSQPEWASASLGLGRIGFWPMGQRWQGKGGAGR